MIPGLTALATMTLALLLAPVASYAAPTARRAPVRADDGQGRAALLRPGSGYDTPGAFARVRALQVQLQAIGDSPGRIDGRFGKRTERAVRRFQAAHGLRVDGVVGPLTLAALAAAAPPGAARPGGAPHPPAPPSQPGERTTSTAVSWPRTGSATPRAIWLALLVVPAVGLVVTLGGYMRRRRTAPSDDTAPLLAEEDSIAPPARVDGDHKSNRVDLSSMLRPALITTPVLCIGVAAGAALQSALALYLLYIVVSLLLGAIAATTLVWMLHAWRTPESLAASGLDSNDLTTTHTFSLIVPARDEENVLELTLSRLIKSEHPGFELLVVVGDDDPATGEVAQRVAMLHPDLVRVVVDISSPKSKPKALNAALPYCAGSVTGVFDAEDDVHPALLRRVDQCFQKTDADVVQAGVQLMNFRSSWLTVRNVLEYYFWFRSRLHLHARQRFIPLGGNTVFVRTEVLRAVGGWDPECLAEDCELGVRLSACGARTAVFYEPDLVTREECPPTLGAFVRQRTRWNQGYLQTLSRRYWQQLPFRQRALGLYILAMPYLLALAWLMFPIALGTAVAVKAPIGITLFSFLPAVPMLSILTAEVVGLGEFCRTYGERASARDYARLVVGLPLYQFVLAFSAARAVAREARGTTAWEKTEHLGLHLSGANVEQGVLSPAPSVPPQAGGQRSLARVPGPHPHHAALVPAMALTAGAVAVPQPGLTEGLQSHPLWLRLHQAVPIPGSARPPGAALAPGRLAEASEEWLQRLPRSLRRAATPHVDLAIQGVLALVIGMIVATNARHWPAIQFDEGTYTGDAWAVQHGRLAPYTYSYGHPPLAWLLIFLWTWFHGLFGATTFSIDVGREFMVAVTLVSSSLLYVLARRLDFGRSSACAAVILFGLSPVAVFFHRAVLLDNPSTAWALAAFVLARTPHRRLWAFAGSGACFAASVLCKETSFVLLPALLFAALQNTDSSTRRYCGALLTSFFTLIALSYPLYATLKGELIPGRGHVSLIGYAIVQLVTRKGTGSLFDPHSQTHAIVAQWLHLDPWLLAAALALSPIAIFRRSLRPVAAALLLQVLTILRPGYLPNMYVIGLLPFAALIVPGAIETIWRTSRRVNHRSASYALAASAAVPAAILVLVMGNRWVHVDAASMAVRLDTQTRAAEHWLTGHVSHNERLIVGDEFYVYLIQHGFNDQRMKGGFFSDTVVSYWPLDYDPAVKRRFSGGWQAFDYIVSTEAMRDTLPQTPTATQALAHSVVVTSFGTGAHRIEIRRILSGGA